MAHPKHPLKPSRLLRRRTLPPLLLTVLLILVILALRQSIPPSPSPSPSPYPHLNTSQVKIWHAPRNCSHSFTTTPSPHSTSAFPYAVLRDAVIDRRPVVKRDLGKSDPAGTLRVVLYLTLHLSARLTRERAVVSVGGGRVLGVVEYVHQTTQFLTRGPYTPGKKTVFGREVSEWQVGLRLEPRVKGWQVAESRAEELSVALSVIRFDEVVVPFFVKMGLECVLGWEVGEVHGGGGECGRGGEGSEGAVLISGSALYGDKRRKRQHWREVANFAARALGGGVVYEYVVMSVVSLYSGSEIWAKCGGDLKCREGMEGENEKLMESIGREVEEEMRRIGVAEEMVGKVLLVPSCRLGSAVEGGEGGDPCKKSKRYGQYYATYFTYAMVGGGFKWAVCHDMDEFVAPSVPSVHKMPLRAVRLLDEAERVTGGDGGEFVFQWLNFRVRDLEDVRWLSKDVVGGKKVVLKNREKEAESERCYYKLADNTGKSAARCDVGLGFTIHHPVLVVPGAGMMKQRQGNRMYFGLRTWHARLGRAKGSCDYTPNLT